MHVSNCCPAPPRARPAQRRELRRLHRHGAPGHGQHGAGHVTAFAGRQQHVRTGQFGRLAGTLHRHLLAEGLDFLGLHGGRDQRRPDRARQHGVGADAAVGQQLRQVRREVHDRALGGRVGQLARLGRLAIDRRRVDDGRARFQMRHGGLDDIKHRVQVHIEVALPVFHADLVDAVGAFLERGVVDHDVKLAQLAHGSVHQRLAVGRVGHVAGHQHGAAARLFDPARGFAGVVFFAQVGDQDVGAFARVGDRHGAADAAVGARDQGHLALQLAGTLIALFAVVGTRVERAGRAGPAREHPLQAVAAGTGRRACWTGTDMGNNDVDDDVQAIEVDRTSLARPSGCNRAMANREPSYGTACYGGSGTMTGALVAYRESAVDDRAVIGRGGCRAQVGWRGVVVVHHVGAGGVGVGDADPQAIRGAGLAAAVPGLDRVAVAAAAVEAAGAGHAGLLAVARGAGHLLAAELEVAVEQHDRLGGRRPGVAQRRPYCKPQRPVAGDAAGRGRAAQRARAVQGGLGRIFHDDVLHQLGGAAARVGHREAQSVGAGRAEAVPHRHLSRTGRFAHGGRGRRATVGPHGAGLVGLRETVIGKVDGEGEVLAQLDQSGQGGDRAKYGRIGAARAGAQHHQAGVRGSEDHAGLVDGAGAIQDQAGRRAVQPGIQVDRRAQARPPHGPRRVPVGIARRRRPADDLAGVVDVAGAGDAGRQAGQLRQTGGGRPLERVIALVVADGIAHRFAAVVERGHVRQVAAAVDRHHAAQAAPEEAGFVRVAGHVGPPDHLVARIDVEAERALPAQGAQAGRLGPQGRQRAPGIPPHGARRDARFGVQADDDVAVVDVGRAGHAGAGQRAHAARRGPGEAQDVAARRAVFRRAHHHALVVQRARPRVVAAQRADVAHPVAVEEAAALAVGGEGIEHGLATFVERGAAVGGQVDDAVDRARRGDGRRGGRGAGPGVVRRGGSESPKQDERKRTLALTPGAPRRREPQTAAARPRQHKIALADGAFDNGRAPIQTSGKLAASPMHPDSMPSRPRFTYSLRHLLIMLTAIGLLPLAMLGTWSIHTGSQYQQREQQRLMLDLVRALSSAVDAELDGAVAILTGLGRAPELQDGELQAFHGVARDLVKVQPEWLGVILTDDTGKVLLRTMDEFGSLSAGPAIADPDSLREALATRQPVVGHIARGPRGRAAFPVRVPVITASGKLYTLTAVIKPDRLMRLLDRQQVPGGAVSAIRDSARAVVARSRNQESAVGAPPTASLIALMNASGAEGVGSARTREGRDMVTAYTTLSHYNWVTVVGRPAEQLHAAALQGLGVYGAGIFISLLVSIALASLLSTRLVTTIRALQQNAAALGSGAALTRSTSSITEVEEISQALVLADSQRNAHERERKLLLDSLNQALTSHQAALADAREAGRAKDEFLAPARARRDAAPGRSPAAPGGRSAGRVAHHFRQAADRYPAAEPGRRGPPRGGGGAGPVDCRVAAENRVGGGRRQPPDAGAQQPAVERGALRQHRYPRGAHGRRRPCAAGGGRRRHRHEHRAAGARVRTVPAGAAIAGAAHRRPGSRPGHRAQDRGAAWRPGVGQQRRSGPGQPVRGAAAAGGGARVGSGRTGRRGRRRPAGAAGGRQRGRRQRRRRTAGTDGPPAARRRRRAPGGAHRLRPEGRRGTRVRRQLQPAPDQAGVAGRPATGHRAAARRGITRYAATSRRRHVHRLLRERRGAAAQVKARVRRLVVAGVLARHLGAVLRVVHQGGDTGAGRDRGAEQQQRRIAGVAHHDFLAPVAQQVGRQHRRGLGAVVGGAAVCAQVEQVGHAGRGRIPLLHDQAAQRFAQQVAVPPHAEVHRRGRRGADLHARGRAQAAAAGPAFLAHVTGIDVEAHAPSHVGAGSAGAPEHGARGGVVQLGAVVAVAGGALVHHVDLLAAAVGVEFAEVQRVAVTEAGGVQQLAVAADGGRAVHDVVLAVAIGVAGGKPVRALAARGAARHVGVEHPAAGEVAVAPVPGRDHGARVVPARKHGAGACTVEVRHAAQEAVYPVAVVVAPAGHRAARGQVVDGFHGGARLAVEHGQELGAGQHVAGAVAVVGAGRADGRALAVHRAVGRLGHHLGQAVAVEIVRQERGVVGARADVLAEVDAPQARAVEFVGVQIRVARVAGLGVILGVGRLPFDDQFVRAVAVQVGRGAVVDLVRVRHAIGRGAPGRRLHRDRFVRRGPGGARAGICLFDAAHHRAHCVMVGGAAAPVAVVERIEWRAVELLAVAVHIERGVGGVGRQLAPADEHAIAGLDGHGAAIEPLDLLAGRCRVAEARGAGQLTLPQGMRLQSARASGGRNTQFVEQCCCFWRRGAGAGAAQSLSNMIVWRSAQFFCGRFALARLIERGGRHGRDLAEGGGKRGRAGEPEFVRHLRDGFAPAQAVHRLHDARPLPPHLERQARLGQEQAADRAHGRRCARGNGIHAQFVAHVATGDRDNAQPDRAGGQGQERGRIGRVGQFVQHQPHRQCGLVGAAVQARVGGKSGIEQRAQQGRDAQREWPVEPGGRGPGLGRGRLPVDHPQFRVRQHFHPVRHPGRHPHTELRRHQPAARRRVHFHHAGSGKGQLGLVMAVQRGGAAARLAAAVQDPATGAAHANSNDRYVRRQPGGATGAGGTPRAAGGRGARQNPRGRRQPGRLENPRRRRPAHGPDIAHRAGRGNQRRGGAGGQRWRGGRGGRVGGGWRQVQAGRRRLRHHPRRRVCRIRRGAGSRPGAQTGQPGFHRGCRRRTGRTDGVAGHVRPGAADQGAAPVDYRRLGRRGLAGDPAGQGGRRARDRDGVRPQRGLRARPGRGRLHRLHGAAVRGGGAGGGHGDGRGVRHRGRRRVCAGVFRSEAGRLPGDLGSVRVRRRPPARRSRGHRPGAGAVPARRGAARRHRPAGAGGPAGAARGNGAAAGADPGGAGAVAGRPHAGQDRDRHRRLNDAARAAAGPAVVSSPSALVFQSIRHVIPEVIQGVHHRRHACRGPVRGRLRVRGAGRLFRLRAHRSGRTQKRQQGVVPRRQGQDGPSHERSPPRTVGAFRDRRCHHHLSRIADHQRPAAGLPGRSLGHAAGPVARARGPDRLQEGLRPGPVRRLHRARWRPPGAGIATASAAAGVHRQRRLPVRLLYLGPAVFRRGPDERRPRAYGGRSAIATIPTGPTCLARCPHESRHLPLGRRRRRRAGAPVWRRGRQRHAIEGHRGRHQPARPDEGTRDVAHAAGGHQRAAAGRHFTDAGRRPAAGRHRAQRRYRLPSAARAGHRLFGHRRPDAPARDPGRQRPLHRHASLGHVRGARCAGRRGARALGRRRAADRLRRLPPPARRASRAGHGAGRRRIDHPYRAAACAAVCGPFVLPEIPRPRLVRVRAGVGGGHAGRGRGRPGARRAPGAGQRGAQAVARAGSGSGPDRPPGRRRGVCRSGADFIGRRARAGPERLQDHHGAPRRGANVTDLIAELRTPGAVPGTGTVQIGDAVSRVDGRDKVTGQARYAAEYVPDLAGGGTPAAQDSGLLYGVVVSGAIARGHIKTIDPSAALGVPGVVDVIWHENRPKIRSFDIFYKDMTAPGGSPYRPLYDNEVHYSGQPVALVVADTFEAARYAASLVRVDYDEEPHQTYLLDNVERAYKPSRLKAGYTPPPDVKGHPDEMWEKSPVRIEGEYYSGVEHHNPLEMFATTVIRDDDGHFTIYDKTQSSQNSRWYVSHVFGLSNDKVTVRNPYVGGAFGSGLRPQYQLPLAVMAALKLERSVRVVLTRQQMFTFGHRPETQQRIKLSAEADGTLTSIVHEAVAETSRYEDYVEVVVNWSGELYACEHIRLGYKVVDLDHASPMDMRAPGAAHGVHALEVAMDELSYQLKMDPLALRLKNYAEIDPTHGLPYSTKELRECYLQGAARFGWDQHVRPRQRRAAPRRQPGREQRGHRHRHRHVHRDEHDRCRGHGPAAGKSEVPARRLHAAGGADRRRFVPRGHRRFGRGGRVREAAKAPVQAGQGLARFAAGQGALRRRGICRRPGAAAQPARFGRGAVAGAGRRDRAAGRKVPDAAQYAQADEVPARHPLGSIRGSAGGPGIRHRARDARGQRDCGGAHHQRQDGAQPDHRRRGVGHRPGAARGDPLRPSPGALHEPQPVRVPRVGQRRHPRHRRHFCKRRRPHRQPHRRQGRGRNRPGGRVRRSVQRHLPRHRSARAQHADDAGKGDAGMMK
uniref:Indole-3-acetaldehyde oxidase n=1 Tax=Tanacetum cinerariifolium TaxID=118510 RepID=A0A699GFT0_TANCI|nr:indole-3-acetaldehyde oxidase [Tanacetum cinerariifolium]